MAVEIGFSTSDSWLGKVIKWFSKGTTSHAFLVWDDPSLGKMVMEAGWDGFHVKTFDKALKGSTVVALVPLKRGGGELLKVCSKWLGDSYDYPGLFGSALVMVGRWFKQKWKNPSADGKALFCSESIAIGLKMIKYPGAQVLKPAETTPQDLLDFLVKK